MMIKDKCNNKEMVLLSGRGFRKIFRVAAVFGGLVFAYITLWYQLPTFRPVDSISSRFATTAVARTANASSGSNGYQPALQQLPPPPVFPSEEAFFRANSKAALTPLRELDQTQYTIRLLSWKAADLLAASVHWHSQCPGVRQIQVVWSQLQEDELDGQPLPQEVLDNPKVVVERRTTNVLTNRFDILPTTPTETLAIFNLDDDLLFSCDALDMGFFQWAQQPHRMLSYYPRSHTTMGEEWKYSTKYDSDPQGYSLGLTGAAFIHRDYLSWYTSYLPRNIYQYVGDHLNCEDISMSLFLSNLTDAQPPQVIDEWIIYSKATIQRQSSSGTHQGISSKYHANMKKRSYCVDSFATQLLLKGKLQRIRVQQLTEYNESAITPSQQESFLSNPRFLTLRGKQSIWRRMPTKEFTNRVILPTRNTLADYAKNRSLASDLVNIEWWRKRFESNNNVQTKNHQKSSKPVESDNYRNSTTTAPECFLDNSLAARDRWLKGEGGYIMIHHVRRAGGSTLCGILTGGEDGHHPLLDSNCILKPSKLVGNSLSDRYTLRRFHNVSVLENEMERQGTKIVAVEGYELPAWFLKDPERSKRWTIITSIRDPIDRLVSISKTKCPQDPSKCWSSKVDQATRYPLNNVMTRMFAGGYNDGRLGDPNQPVTEDDLAKAINLLETQYQMILVTEWITEMAPIFKYWFGLEGASGSQRRGFDGKHSMGASTLGRSRAALHYAPESSARVSLRKYSQKDDIYLNLVEEHSFDVRLVEHFKERERQRMFNCFLFRSSNLPNGD